MGRLRYIEPEVWQNAELRRLGWVGRQVFLFLFSCWADDEGRFKWDPLAILETAFSRSDPTDEEGVCRALEGLMAAGMTLQYGERGEFGFLTGWFLHQSMDRRYRRPSALPPPPITLSSWAAVDKTRAAYAKHSKAKDERQVTYRESIRWFIGKPAQPPRKSRATLAAVPRESRGSPAPEGEVEVEVDVTPPPHLQKTKAVDVNVAVNGYLTSGGGGETADGYNPEQVPDWDKIAWELSMIGLRKTSRRSGQPSIDGMRSAIKKGKLTEDEIWEALCACRTRTDVRNPVGFILQRLEDGFVDREST